MRGRTLGEELVLQGGRPLAASAGREGRGEAKWSGGGGGRRVSAKITGGVHARENDEMRDEKNITIVVT